MIATAQTISYGKAKINYDANKSIEGVKVASELLRRNLYGDTANEMIEEMNDIRQSYRPNLQKCYFDFVITLSADDAEKITTDEQAKDLLNEFMQKMMVEKMNLSVAEYEKMQWIAFQHDRTTDNSKLKHWHILANRVLIDGKVISDSLVGWKAMQNAIEISKALGFSDAIEVSEKNKKQLSDIAFAVLKEMPKYDFADFKNRMAKKGIEIVEARSGNGKLNGYYLIAKSGTKYKASDISKGLTLSRIENTFSNLHPTKKKSISPAHARLPQRQSRVNSYANIGNIIPAVHGNAAVSSSSSEDMPNKHKKRWEDMTDDEKREAAQGYNI
jgi:hypothetical protein